MSVLAIKTEGGSLVKLAAPQLFFFSVHRVSRYAGRDVDLID